MENMKRCAKLDKFLCEPVSKMRDRMRQSKRNYYVIENGTEIVAVPERNFETMDKGSHELLGAYNYDITCEELRGDIIWYIENVMEARK